MLRKLLYNGPSFDVLHEESAKRGRIDGQAQLIASGDIVIEADVDAVWQRISMG